MYTERLDVTIEDVDAVLRVAKKCKMHAVCYPIIKQSVKHSQWIQSQLTSDFCLKQPHHIFPDHPNELLEMFVAFAGGEGGGG